MCSKLKIKYYEEESESLVYQYSDFRLWCCRKLTES